MTTYADALQNHQANLKNLDSLVKKGKKETSTRFGMAWPNACEWITAGKTQLHALTQTHDADARATTLGAAGKKAMFGIDTPVPTASTYDENDLTKATNIYNANPTWLGFRRAGSPSLVVIIEPTTKGEDSVKETITHEVQHDADHHGGDAWGGYSTEFRAYWIDGTYRNKSEKSGSANETLTASDGTVLSGFDNARQQTIFRHLYNSSSYAYVKANWGDDTFKRKVLALKSPEGSNLVNSPRIDDVYLELVKATPSLETLKTLAGKLTKKDKEAIASSGMKAQWEELLKAKFKDDELKSARKALGL